MKTCEWCQQAPCTTSGQAKQRFCSPRCRTSFHSALRAYGQRAFDNGDVGLRELRDLAGIRQPKRQEG